MDIDLQDLAIKKAVHRVSSNLALGEQQFDATA